MEAGEYWINSVVEEFVSRRESQLPFTHGLPCAFAATRTETISTPT